MKVLQELLLYIFIFNVSLAFVATLYYIFGPYDRHIDHLDDDEITYLYSDQNKK